MHQVFGQAVAVHGIENRRDVFFGERLLGINNVEQQDKYPERPKPRQIEWHIYYSLSIRLPKNEHKIEPVGRKTPLGSEANLIVETLNIGIAKRLKP